MKQHERIIREICSLRQAVTHNTEQLAAVLDSLKKLTCKEPEYEKRTPLFPFMESISVDLRNAGKFRTSESYTSTMSSFRKFLKGKDIMLDEITAPLISAYESYLKKSGISHNSSSFYMRNLRAVYNRAVEQQLTAQRNPFRDVYTGVEKTHKRALPLETIRQLRDMSISVCSPKDFARDMFLFSFYTRGMSFIDMAFLKKSDLKDGFLSYCRHKTGQRLIVKWEACMQAIVSKYDTSHSPYLLPVICSPGSDERRQYLYAAHKINRSLKTLGKSLCLPIPLTMYVARHSWASAARSRNIPLPVISESMGHESDKTTHIYLSSLDNMVIDNANSLVLESLG